MKRRIMIIILALAIAVVSMTACNSGGQQSQAQEPPSSAAAPGTSEPAPQTSEPAPQISESAPPTSNESDKLNLLDKFEKNPDMFRNLASGNFSSDPADAPSDEELTRMLDFAMAAASGHGQTPWQFVVVRDYEEQLKIFGELFNSVTPGTVGVLVYGDQLLSQEFHDEPYTSWYDKAEYGIYDMGHAAGYFQLAAYALDYMTHTYLVLNLPKTDGAGYVSHPAYSYTADEYLSSKDGKVDFTHQIGLYAPPPDNGAGETKEIVAKGNLQFYCGVLIGKMDKSLDVVTAATPYARGKNYNFYDPQDGVSYGTSVPAGQKLNTSSSKPWDGLSDGTYTGKGKSTSSEYTVAATVKGGKITAIEITEGKEKMFAEAALIDTFIKSIITAQNLKVDAVSGATQDCNGIISALNEAFAQ